MRNPVRKISQENDWSASELSLISDLSPSCIYQNLSGANREVSPELLVAFEEAGYDPEKIQAEYQEYRRQKRLEMLKVRKNSAK
ncbi:MAG: hypothetical protein ABR596_04750 [Halarsenatibacteraceae bacterium]